MGTGGVLNFLNGKYGISWSKRSVPVMNLIRQHGPKSRRELAILIASHSKSPPCECGILSEGTVKDFGRSLFDAQLKEWKEYRFTLDQCIRWEYDLFVVNSLKGNAAEEMAKRSICEGLGGPPWYVSESSEEVDNVYRVDLVVCREKDTEGRVCGIQVKPETYKRMRNSVKKMNEKCNDRWGNPVFYLYYNSETKFVNLESVLSDIRDHLWNRDDHDQ